MRLKDYIEEIPDFPGMHCIEVAVRVGDDVVIECTFAEARCVWGKMSA